MAYIRAHNTTIKRKGKVVKRYEVVWREPATDPTTGLPTGKVRSRQESYPTREQAEARRDALNNAKHNIGGTAALADAKKAGELPFSPKFPPLRGV
jgi:integrase